MKFTINKIMPSMTKDEKILEYARRISFYHLMMSEERKLSKVFACTELKRNSIGNNGAMVGCLKRPDLEPCQSCSNAARHYLNYRDYNKRKATATRQLNRELLHENTKYDEYESIIKLLEVNNEDY